MSKPKFYSPQFILREKRLVFLAPPGESFSAKLDQAESAGGIVDNMSVKKNHETAIIKVALEINQQLNGLDAQARERERVLGELKQVDTDFDTKIGKPEYQLYAGRLDAIKQRLNKPINKATPDAGIDTAKATRYAESLGKMLDNAEQTKKQAEKELKNGNLFELALGGSQENFQKGLDQQLFVIAQSLSKFRGVIGKDPSYNAEIEGLLGRFKKLNGNKQIEGVSVGGAMLNSTVEIGENIVNGKSSDVFLSVMKGVGTGVIEGFTVMLKPSTYVALWEAVKQVPELATNPKARNEFLTALQKQLAQLGDEFKNAPPDKQGEMIGRAIGQMIGAGKFTKFASRFAKEAKFIAGATKGIEGVGSKLSIARSATMDAVKRSVVDGAKANRASLSKIAIKAQNATVKNMTKGVTESIKDAGQSVVDTAKSAGNKLKELATPKNIGKDLQSMKQGVQDGFKNMKDKFKSRGERLKGISDQRNTIKESIQKAEKALIENQRKLATLDTKGQGYIFVKDAVEDQVKNLNALNKDLNRVKRLHSAEKHYFKTIDKLEKRMKKAGDDQGAIGDIKQEHLEAVRKLATEYRDNMGATMSFEGSRSRYINLERQMAKEMGVLPQQFKGSKIFRYGDEIAKTELKAGQEYTYISRVGNKLKAKIVGETKTGKLIYSVEKNGTSQFQAVSKETFAQGLKQAKSVAQLSKSAQGFLKQSINTAKARLGAGVDLAKQAPIAVARFTRDLITAHPELSRAAVMGTALAFTHEVFPKMDFSLVSSAVAAEAPAASNNNETSTNATSATSPENSSPDAWNSLASQKIDWTDRAVIEKENVNAMKNKTMFVDATSVIVRDENGAATADRLSKVNVTVDASAAPKEIDRGNNKKEYYVKVKFGGNKEGWINAKFLKTVEQNSTSVAPPAAPPDSAFAPVPAPASAEQTPVSGSGQARVEHSTLA